MVRLSADSEPGRRVAWDASAPGRRHTGEARGRAAGQRVAELVEEALQAQGRG
ncbi:hypothetical protein ACFQE0_26225 [Methylobacterium komagatae]|uniref:Hydroxymethylbilane synthase n=1 Tax=Methylobacterium komagatae TaxID=374425 RepID=A0ABW2BS03_9HYPH